MPTYATRVVYDLPTIGLTNGGEPVDAADVMRVEAIRDPAGVDLVPVSWRTYAQGSRGWIRDVGPRHRTWARLGRSLVIVSPALDIDSTVTLVYVDRCPGLASDDTTTVLRDDRLPAVLALAEALLLLHRRLYPGAVSAMQTLDAVLARLPRAGGTGQAAFYAAGGTGP